jgi:hypothetical protein
MSSVKQTLVRRLDPTPLPPPSPIATIDELTQSHNAIVKKENKDKASLTQIANPNRISIRAALISWTSRGFPANFVILSIPISQPNICSDGIQRSIEDYISYLLGNSIHDELTKLQPQLVGITLSYSITNNNLNIQVSNAT